MKILLLGINARFTHVNTALYYLRQSIVGLPYDVSILEKTINDSTWDILNEIYEITPDVLCLSCYIWNQDHIEAVLRDVKKVLPSVLIVCGGPDISFNSKNRLNDFPQIDYIIQGAGEKSFRYLAEQNFQFQQKIINMPNYSFSDIPLPYVEDDFNVLKNRYIYYEASRGCPFKCSYCMSSREDQKLEVKTFEQIKSEVDFLLSYEKFNPIIIKFIDRSFNVNSELAINIWEYLISIDTITKFHFEIHPLFLNDKQFEVLYKTPNNRFQFELGIQSIKEETLSLINRSGSWDDIKSKILKLKSIQTIKLHLDLIAGLPNETFLDIINSFNEILKLEPDHFQPGFLKLLPGTALLDEAKKWTYTYQEKAPYRVFSSNSINFTELQLFEIAENSLDILYNSRILKLFFSNFIKATHDPFSLFLEFGKYLKKNNINKFLSDKKKVISLFYQFIEQMINHSSLEFYRDCIRFDWFCQASTHYYPDDLMSDCCDTFKINNYNNFKKYWQSYTLSLKQENELKKEVFKEKLRNFCFFAPKNALFKNKYLNNANGIVNIDQKQFFLIYSSDNQYKIAPIDLNDIFTVL